MVFENLFGRKGILQNMEQERNKKVDGTVLSTDFKLLLKRAYKTKQSIQINSKNDKT